MDVEKVRQWKSEGSHQSSTMQIVLEEKWLENVTYFKYLSSLKNCARCTSEIESRIVVLRTESNNKNTLFTLKLDSILRNKVVKCYIWSIALYGSETWTLRKIDKKYLESYKMWYWRSMEKISLNDCVRNEEMLHRMFTNEWGSFKS